MKISVWRWSHLVLAVASLLFILSASITGAILTFDPLSHQTTGSVDQSQPIYKTIEALKEEYSEVFKIEKNTYGEWVADIMTDEGESQQILVHPVTGENLGQPQEQSNFFKQITAFHRSLFMGTAGRWIIAIATICLLLISVTGLFLVAQKLGGWLKFFTKVKKEDSAPYYHTVLGRYSSIIILIISISGALMFFKDSWVPTAVDTALDPYIDDAERDETLEQLSMFAPFQVPLSDVVKVEFPFSDDPEDAYLLETTSKVSVIHQQTGEIAESIEKDQKGNLFDLMFSLHTGHNMGYWPIVLLFACLNILYFIYSGLVISTKRWTSKFKNVISAEQAEIIIFVGSENGSTWQFAKTLHNALLEDDQNVRTVGMESTETFPNAKNVFIFTSTYGTGDAPQNARKFLKNQESLLRQNVNFSVLGFGSKQYVDFCKYAFDLNQLLNGLALNELIDFHTIDNKSIQQYLSWVNKLTSIDQFKNLKVKLDFEKPKTNRIKVLSNNFNNSESPYFTIQLASNRKVKSGDLISILPPNSLFARQYSIAKTDEKVITLYLRKHDFGQCSTYLSEIQVGCYVNAFIDSNPSFHYDHKTTAYCIGNGTGIAPFIGYSFEQSNAELNIIWGTKTANDAQKITSRIQTESASLKLCFSQEKDQPKIYASNYFIDLIPSIEQQLLNGAKIYICGAIQMDLDIKKALINYAKSKGLEENIFLKNIHSDCY